MIVPMKRLTLIGLKTDEELLLKALQEIAAVHIISKEDVNPDTDRLVDLDTAVQRLSDAHKLLGAYAEKSGLTPTPQYTPEELESCLNETLELVGRIEELDRSLSSVRSERDKRVALVNTLLAWEQLDTPVERIEKTRHVRFITGFVKAADMMALSQSGLEYQEFPGERESAVIVVCHSADYEETARALKELNFTDFTFPKLKGTPKAIISDERARIAELDASEAELMRELTESSKKRKELEKAYDAAGINREREASKKQLTLTDSVFVLEGWVREDQTDTVDVALSSATDAYYLDVREPEEGEEPPTAMKNNAIVTPFEAVTNMYSRPAYTGVDPTSTLTPWYLLFFGMMLADTGYGLVLFLGGLLYSKLLKPRGGTKSLAKVISMCGLSTMILGFVLGSFFGMSWAEVFGEGTVFPLIDPLNNIMTMIIICCGLGLLHMFWGIGVKIYMCLRDGDISCAICDNFSWLLLLTGLVGLLASGFVNVPWLKTACVITAGVGAVIILLFAGRTKKNVFKRIGGGLGALYNITSYLGDTLSYVRILALGLVGGAMGMVFNLIGSMIFDGLSGLGIGGAIIGAILAGAVMLVLHAFSLFINTLGTYVHCARLQYVEFMGKFYEPNGLDFKPLGYGTRYVNVKK